MAGFLVIDVYSIVGIGTVAVGRVASGELRPGMKARSGSGVIEVVSIEAGHRPLKSAPEGANVGISVRTAGSGKGIFSKFGQGNASGILKGLKGTVVEFA